MALSPVHPGEVLAETLQERHMSQSEFAMRVGVSNKHINEIIHGHTTYSEALTIDFERVLGKPSAEFWCRLLADYRLARARAAKRV